MVLWAQMYPGFTHWAGSGPGPFASVSLQIHEGQCSKGTQCQGQGKQSEPAVSPAGQRAGVEKPDEAETGEAKEKGR